ncbi:MAG: ribosomal protein S18-alanine N-acetyltransferase [Chloroflexota bacterium]
MTTIRPVQLKRDLPAILRIEQDIFGDGAFGIGEFLYYYMQNRETFLVALSDEALVGYICTHSDEHEAYIASIAVAPSMRRQGIGRQLLMTVIQHYQAQDAMQSISLHVRQSNQGAIALYESLGFDIIGTAQQYYPDEDAYYMCLSLRSDNPPD